MMLSQLFPNWQYYPPATEAEIGFVESQLGICLPAQLRDLYLESNGIAEDLGNAGYLLPLTCQDGGMSLLTGTTFFWTEWAKTIPALDLKPFVFFGLSGGGDLWGIRITQPNEIIAYHHHMAEEYETVGADIIELFRSDYAEYES